VKERKIPTPEKVMIIEDEKDLCYLLAVVLKQNNLRPACVYSIKEAKKIIREIKPSIVFLDNHLPDGYGFDFIILLKAIYPDTKIVMITAQDSPADIDLAFRRGADYFISKPFDVATINTTLNLLTTEFSKKPVPHLTS
jgi:two-component system OmpR family response regulator